MALENQSAQSKQATAIVAGRIHSLRNRLEGAARNQRTQHIQWTTLKLGCHYGFEEAPQSFRRFQHDITDKTIAHHDIRGAFEDVVTFDITVKIENDNVRGGTP